VAGRFVLLDGRSYGFELTGPYDPALPLVIDPELAWSTYLGGNLWDCGNDVAVDAAGNVLVTGETIWVSGGYMWKGVLWEHAFVVKLSPDGGHLWSTYLGGGMDDHGYGVAVDAAGNVLVTGYTHSPGWVSGGFDTSYNDGGDAFVVKLSPSGTHLWSTYLGGDDCDAGYGVAVDAAGNVLVTGKTWSDGWVSGGFDTSYNDGGDAFVVKLSPSGTHLWSTYLGGDDCDEGYGVAVDAAGNVLVTGYTHSPGWVSGGFDTSYNDGGDAFVVKLSPSGTHLWSTYLGGDDWDAASGVAVDAAGNVLVTGQTGHTLLGLCDGWVSGGFDTSYNDGGDAFVVKLSPSGTQLWSTYLGGDNLDAGCGVAVDAAGNVLVTGYTESSGWVSGGFDTTHNGGEWPHSNDAFVVKLSPSGGHLWSTYLGGSDDDYGYGVAVDAAGNVLVTGQTWSDGWVSGGFDTSFNGPGSVFVAKITGLGDLVQQWVYNSAFLTDEQIAAHWSMGVEQVRAFLAGRNSYFRQPVSDVDGVVFDMPAVIVDAAQQYQINPQVLLVTLQKESAAVTTSGRPSDTRMRLLMGAGSPSTARAQVYEAAPTLSRLP
jgi:predicted enzyme related to lactoylglutathione lyase